MAELTSATDLCRRLQKNIFKILIIGDSGVGKTSIIKQSALKCFSPHYRATIGVDFVMNRMELQEGQVVKMHLWDIAGQERFSKMTRAYYKDALGAFIVYDLSRPETYTSIFKWKEDLDAKVFLPNGNGIPCIILANKCDETIPAGASTIPADADRWCKQNGFLGFIETSAKTNVGVDLAFQRMAELLVYRKDYYSYMEPSILENADLVNLTDDNKVDTSKRSCNVCRND